VPKLRLFAQAREAAGTAHDDVPGRTVAEVLMAAGQRYGDEFVGVAERCKIWVNGSAADGSVAVTEDDEVALLPPVSGG
jgi:sulfur-carrier protein